MACEQTTEREVRGEPDANSLYYFSLWMDATREIKRLRSALESIASCDSRYPGNVVDVAREALK